MAHFRGIIQGSRGEASRLGGKNSGIKAVLSSWDNHIHVYLYDKDGMDFARIYFRDAKTGAGQDIYDGPVPKPEKKTAKALKGGTKK